MKSSYKMLRMGIVSFLLVFLSKNCVGGILASGGESGTVKVWDTSNGKLIKTLWPRSKTRKPTVRALAFSPDGTRLVASRTDGRMRVWDTSNWTVLKTLRNSSAGFTSLAFSPDGKMLVSGLKNGSVEI